MTKEETDSTNSVTKTYSWDDVTNILNASGNTGGMKRRYENRIKYRIWVRNIKARYGSIADYIYKERLRWVPDRSQETLVFPVKSATQFADADDYKILWNDWPYGSLEPDVKHLIVWLKQPLPADPDTGRLPAEQRAIVQAFVDRTFILPMKVAGIVDARDRLRWFKNGFDLQSIKTIDHFHVLVKHVPEELLFKWTGGKEPVV